MKPQSQPATATATPVRADRTTLWLHERGGLRVRLAVKGPAPLRVELPATLLDTESELKWSIQPAAPPKLIALDDGREEWSQEFQLGAFAYGKAVRVGFAPIKIKAGGAPERDVTAPAFEVRVRSRFDGEDGQEQLDPEQLRHEARVTSIEELPSRPPNPPEPTAWLLAAAAGAVALGVLAALIRRARRKPPPRPPQEWALVEFDRLEERAFACADLAEVLREFTARRFGIAAPQLTTAELLAEAQRAEWPAEATAALGELLERCDRAKFAGEAPDDQELQMMLRCAREWVTAASPPAVGGL